MTKQQPAPGRDHGPLALITGQPYLLLVLAPIFWGGNLVAGKAAVGQIDPFLLLVGRWFGASLILIVLAAPHMKTDWPRVRASMFWLVFYGVLGFATFNILMYSSAYHTAAINASIEQAAIPVLVLLGNFLVFKVRAKLLQVVGLVLTIIGVIWVATHGDPQRILALSMNIGDGMVLAACLCYAIYSLVLRYRPDIHWLSFMFVTALAALAASLVFVVFIGGGIPRVLAAIPQTTLIGWVCIGYVMIFPSIMAQLCYARGVELVGPNRASIFINLLPITGTVLSIIILGERLEMFHLISAVLVVAGIALSEYTVRSRAMR